MIVVDTNVIAYLLISGENTQDAETLFEQDSTWLAPILWRSEFRNILILYSRHSYIDFQKALQIMAKAEQLMKGCEFEINSTQVLETSFKSTCSAYDSEFVALAKELGIKLITTDQKILKQFPNETSSIKSYIISQ